MSLLFNTSGLLYQMPVTYQSKPFYPFLLFLLGFTYTHHGAPGGANGGRGWITYDWSDIQHPQTHASCWQQTIDVVSPEPAWESGLWRWELGSYMCSPHPFVLVLLGFLISEIVNDFKFYIQPYSAWLKVQMCICKHKIFSKKMTFLWRCIKTFMWAVCPSVGLSVCGRSWCSYREHILVSI